MSAKQSKSIYRPCDCCIHAKDCTLMRGCWQWRTYFRAYWAALRKRFLTM